MPKQHKQIPIQFNPAMVAALNTGRKTQTRRIIKDPPYHDDFEFDDYFFMGDDKPYARWIAKLHMGDQYHSCPVPAKIGDLLWVKEAHFAYGQWITTDDLLPSGKPKRKFVRAWDVAVKFKSPKNVQSNTIDHVEGWYKRTSMFMHRCDSRLTLPITDVMIERLQDISKTDAIAEGIEIVGDGWRDYSKDDGWWLNDPIQSYRTLWNHINGPDAWGITPWVTVTEFEVINQNVAEVE